MSEDIKIFYTEETTFLGNPDNKMNFNHFFKLLCYLVLACMPFKIGVVSASETVKIGVLAQRGPELTLTKLNPLADYLNKEIPELRFTIVPIDFRDVLKAVKNNDVDFIFVNPGIYVELEYSFGVRPIATVRTKHGTKGVSLFAGSIITRADRSDILSFQDLRGKTFMAVDRDSLGGWLMAKRELELSGINTGRDFKSFSYAGTHDGVVRAVLNGDVDAGAIRSDILENMAEDRLIDISKFRVIHGDRVHFNFEIGEDDFPYPHSTDIYPEWPMARLPGTADELARKVAIALLKMSGNENATIQAGFMGWDIARNYQSVHDLYRELRIGPYRKIDYLRVSDVWERYWPTIISIALFLSTLCVSLFFFVQLRFRLLKANQEITRMAMYDPLTHLPNRCLFRILAEKAFAQARREGWKVYLFLIDLDGFKFVNDTFGHESGDEVLRQIGQRLCTILPFPDTVESPSCSPSLKNRINGEVLRAEDLVARHGGDEFLGMLIHVKGIDDVKSIAQRVVDTIQKPIKIADNQAFVGASIGITVFPDDGENLEALIKNADQAMYDVKRSGKGTYMFYRHPLK